MNVNAAAINNAELNALKKLTLAIAQQFDTVPVVGMLPTQVQEALDEVRGEDCGE